MPVSRVYDIKRARSTGANVVRVLVVLPLLSVLAACHEQPAQPVVARAASSEAPSVPVAVYATRVPRPPTYRIDRGVPAAAKITMIERRVIERVQSQLNAAARRDLAIAFVPVIGGRRLVVFVIPRSGLSNSAGTRSLSDCASRPNCRHYCAVYYVPSMNEVSISTMEQNRCADMEAIWRH